jgi:hypothetical protein
MSLRSTVPILNLMARELQRQLLCVLGNGCSFAAGLEACLPGRDVGAGECGEGESGQDRAHEVSAADAGVG